MPQISYQAIFDNKELTSVSGLTVLAVDPYRPAKRELGFNKLARSDKSKLSSAFYTKKEVIVRVGITRATRALLEASTDSLLSLLNGFEKDLVLKQSGGDRKYICTYSDYMISVSGGSYCESDLVFVCSDSFGYDTVQTQALQLNSISDPARADAATFAGSAPWQVPVATFTFTTISGGTTKIVTFGNPATGQVISISRTWSSGDILEIDSANKTVEVNSNPVAFTGSFPEWASSAAGIAGGISYSDTFTGRVFGLQILYTRRYI